MHSIDGYSACLGSRKVLRLLSLTVQHVRKAATRKSVTFTAHPIQHQIQRFTDANDAKSQGGSENIYFIPNGHELNKIWVIYTKRPKKKNDAAPYVPHIAVKHFHLLFSIQIGESRHASISFQSC
jgi:hypothetical protein